MVDFGVYAYLGLADRSKISSDCDHRPSCSPFAAYGRLLAPLAPS